MARLQAFRRLRNAVGSLYQRSIFPSGDYRGPLRSACFVQDRYLFSSYADVRLMEVGSRTSCVEVAVAGPKSDIFKCGPIRPSVPGFLRQSPLGILKRNTSSFSRVPESATITSSASVRDCLATSASFANVSTACCCEQSRYASKCASAEDGSKKLTISVTFVDKDGDEKTIQVPLGTSMLEAAHENEIELEGACEGSLACSTCHVIVMDEDFYGKLPEPTDEENDMLDLAFGLTETSRLGCQVIAAPELEGMRLALPSATRNFAVDGHVPKPH